MMEWVLGHLGLVIICAVGAVWLVPGIIFGIAGSIEKRRQRAIGLKDDRGAAVDIAIGWAVALFLGPVCIVLWAAGLGKKPRR